MTDEKDTRHKTQDTSTGEANAAPANGSSAADANNEPVSRADELEAKCEEYLAGWKRALADYENLQKQNAAAREDDRRRIRINVAQDLIPVIDNFDQALKFAPKDLPASANGWFAVVQHIGRQFAEVLGNLGITPIDAVGHVFDPNVHESGGSRFEDDKPEQVVLEEVIKGWKVGDIVIRPSKVIVNQK